MQNQADLIHNCNWKTLWIMDAMRYDVFSEICTEENISHSHIPVYSSGCETGMWMRETWNRRNYPEVTLVSNTAIYWKKNNRHILTRFGKTVPLWKHWKTENRTYSSSEVMDTEEVLEYAEKEHIVNPDNRLLIHDIPPHLPYCTPDGKRFIDDKLNVNYPIKSMTEYGKRNGWDTPLHHYKESARASLKKILSSKWLCERGGLVITSDHGEMIGEADTYGHSLIHKLNPVLRIIPWMVVQ